jgi:hypothetical protein
MSGLKSQGSIEVLIQKLNFVFFDDIFYGEFVGFLRTTAA